MSFDNNLYTVWIIKNDKGINILLINLFNKSRYHVVFLRGMYKFKENKWNFREKLPTIKENHSKNFALIYKLEKPNHFKLP